MTIHDPKDSLHPRPSWVAMLQRKNVLSGLLFIAVAAAGLWVSRNYPIGTALRMGTGYVPRLLLWILLLLGVIVMVMGLRAGAGKTQADSETTSVWRPLIFVTASLVTFSLTIERLGLVISILLLIGIGSLATRELRLIEMVLATFLLIVLSVGIFIIGLGLTIPVWPEW
ncbi:MAG: tripartite tricarboxylate transporter TctB family protein [Xanthobacteraceae bacterium]|jgi:hypothetical protein|nr:tripartite tricarboxylate transporter TctB family protein [Xanthobacteraceae bacterium]